jgi:hypothetical protein
MIDDNTAILLIQKLVNQGFLVNDEGGTIKKTHILFTKNDYEYLSLHHSLGKDYEIRNSQIVEAMIPGFLVSASKGEMFIPEQDVVDRFGKTIEQNYPEAGASFLKFAKTYWSLQVLIIHKLRRDKAGLIGFIGGRLLGVLEGELGPLFFPLPGPNKVDPAEREKHQRMLLAHYSKLSSDINIDIEDFIKGNPIIIRDRIAAGRRRSCLSVIIIGTLTLTSIILYRLFFL